MTNLQFADVSAWQGEINWDKYPFPAVAIRVGYGNQGIDKYFTRNWAEAKARGIARLPYWFHQPGHSPAKHVESFLAALGDDPGECPPVWDCETLGNLSAPASLANMYAMPLPEKDSRLYQMGGYYNAGLAKASFLDVIALFASGLKNQLLDEISKLYLGIKAGLGIFPIIYTNPGFWDSYMTPSDIERDCELWVANWDVSAPRIPYAWAKRGKTYRLWQREVKKGQGPVWGMQSQDVDFDEFAGDVAAFNAWAGTSITPPPPPPAPPPAETFTVRIVAEGVGSIWTHKAPTPSSLTRNGALPVGTVVVVKQVQTVSGKDWYLSGDNTWFAGWLAEKIA